MPLVAIVWHVEVHFKTYKHEAAIQSGWHDSARFDASFASRLVLIIGLDQGIQFVEVQLASIHFVTVKCQAVGG